MDKDEMEQTLNQGDVIVVTGKLVRRHERGQIKVWEPFEWLNKTEIVVFLGKTRKWNGILEDSYEDRHLIHTDTVHCYMVMPIDFGGSNFRTPYPVLAEQIKSLIIQRDMREFAEIYIQEQP